MMDMLSYLLGKEAGGSGGGGHSEKQAVEDKDVVFIDYDGEPLHSYDAAEFLAMSAMPSNPLHDGLVAQGWNWTLSDAKEYVSKYGSLVIGQQYTTEDGATKIYINIEDNRNLTQTVCFKASVNGGVMIEWGDGDVTQSSGTGLNNYNHTYATLGIKVITLKITSGTLTLEGSWSNWSLGGKVNIQQPILNQIKMVAVGDNVTIGNYAFQCMTGLVGVSIPKTCVITGSAGAIFQLDLSLLGFVVGESMVKSPAFKESYHARYISFPKTITEYGGEIGSNAIRRLTFPEGCASLPAVAAGDRVLEHVIVPDTVTSLGTSFCTNAKALKSVSLPEGLLSIGNTCFLRNWALREITIPSTVTSIGNNILGEAYGLEYVHMKPTTPPTLGNAQFVPTTYNMKAIYVPYSEDHSILAAYQNAANWSTFADYMQEEPR